ncbi:trigger factor [Limnobacter humi]|uniref:Trigger factor n=1 Tax=Limnobacter humi TaxID=1778671 RepID=A0ABT1WGQ6_9BURK|nr:trigger factor [Limnobacter humi]MCQ8896211.1 trigger factor [Limnobacter humi]
MTETTTTASPLEKTISLKLSVEKINAEVEKRLQKVARTARMPGFRPGKVPMKMVIQTYGPQVHSEVLNDEIGRTFNEEVQKQDLRVAGTPRIEAAEGAAEEALEFNAIFEVFPEVKFGDFAALEVEKTTVEVSDAEVDKTLDILRKQRATFAAVDRAAQDEDKVTLDFVGKIDGVAFAGGTADDFSFVVGKGQMLPEFEAAAKGMKTGETKTFPLSFPEDYHGKDVAGKTAEFDITIKSVEGAQLPELNEEFAKAMGIADGSIDKLREDVRVNLSREVNNRTKAQTKEAVMNALLKVAEFDVPKALIQSETAELAQRAREDLRARGMKDVENIQLPEDIFAAQAERRVRLGLIVSDLVKNNSLQAKPEQVRAYIEEQAQSYENPAEVMQWYFQDRARLADVEAVILEDNVVEYTLAKTKVVEKKLSFDELMGNK